MGQQCIVVRLGTLDMGCHWIAPCQHRMQAMKSGDEDLGGSFPDVVS